MQLKRILMQLFILITYILSVNDECVCVGGGFWPQALLHYLRLLSDSEVCGHLSGSQDTLGSGCFVAPHPTPRGCNESIQIVSWEVCQLPSEKGKGSFSTSLNSVQTSECVSLNYSLGSYVLTWAVFISRIPWSVLPTSSFRLCS